MRQPVECKNCGMKWLRVTCLVPHPPYNDEPITDLQYNCPKCGSNWCEPIEETGYTNRVTTDGEAVKEESCKTKK